MGDRARARDLGIEIGLLPPGRTNSIVDVPGVRVGHVTLHSDGDGTTGRSAVRTGVTVILPGDPAGLFDQRLPAGVEALNGAGEMTGFLTAREWGVIESPVFLTSTMAVGRVFDGAVEALLAANPRIGVDEVVIPVVTECDDSFLNDARTMSVQPRHAAEAMAAARGAEDGPCAEGAVGAGTGMTCFELKGGIGSASRSVETAGGARCTLGVLVLANFGLLERLTIDGVAVGRTLMAEGWPEAGLVGTAAEPRPARREGVLARRSVGAPGEAGSCIAIIATDAPLAAPQLERLARRAGLGLARTGSYAGHGSGEIFLAFSTGLRIPRVAPEGYLEQRTLDDRGLGRLFGAVVEATEEAVINSLAMSPTVVGRDGHASPGLPLDRVRTLLG